MVLRAASGYLIGSVELLRLPVPDRRRRTHDRTCECGLLNVCFALRDRTADILGSPIWPSDLPVPACPVSVAELRLQHLARRITRQAFDELDRFRQLESAELAAAGGDDGAGFGRRAGAADD